MCVRKITQPGESAAESKRPYGRKDFNATSEASTESAPYTRHAQVVATVHVRTSVLMRVAVATGARRLRSEGLMSEVARSLDSLSNQDLCGTLPGV
jgi:hypothetical protein